LSSLALLHGFLSEVRTGLRGRARRLAGYGLALGWLALALALPLVAIALQPGPAFAFALIAGTGVLAVLGLVAAIVLGVLSPTRRWAADEDVARFVGERRPALASDLLSTVELARARPGPGAPSPALVAALTDATAAQVKHVEPATLVDRTRVRRAGQGLVALTVLGGALFALAPSTMIGGWRRLLAAPPHPFGGAAVSSVPLVGDINIRLTPPAYARRPVQELPSTAGDFRALAGTRARITTSALEPSVAVSLLVERDGEESQIIPVVDDGAGLAATVDVTGPARYRFQIETPRHRHKIEALTHTIEIEPDQAPTVELYAPGDDLDVTHMKRIELAYVAEDDLGLAKVELVWDVGGKTERRTWATLPEGPGRAQGKMVWDLAEVALPAGAQVSYHVEVSDTDTIDGPNLGRSRELRLRVFSPRERHEQNLAKQAELAEHLLTELGRRLTAADDAAPRDELHRGLNELAIELGTLTAAYADDPLADKGLREMLETMRRRIDKLVAQDERTVTTGGAPPPAGAARADAGGKPGAVRTGPKHASIDRAVVGELEDDAILLADWLDREQLEGMLDVADEIADHQKRLDELLAEYARTGDEKLKAEIQRQIRAIQQRLAELAGKRAAIAEDVLDQFVHADAMQDHTSEGCLDEVAKLVAAGDAAAAQAKLAECQEQLAGAASALEESLRGLRGDRFTEGEKKLDSLMDELADVAKDQADIAAEADRMFDRYADRADELMKDLGKDARRKLSASLARLKDRLASVPDSGLTPFAREELEIVDQRLKDLERMLDDGDLAEALGMSRQARQGLETIAGELDAAMSDDPSSPWAQATADALDAIERAQPLADKLVDELEHMTPSPDDIMGGDDKRRMDTLRRRQAANLDRAKKLADKAKAESGLPGDAGPAMAKKVGEAAAPMASAEKRMGARDPSGARDGARAAAEALEKARKDAQSAARNAQASGSSATGDQPVRIPGADQYKAPAQFREQLLEAMKKRPPAGYDEQVRRYYEELVR
jgi:uncharacterized protein YicC (UPF0701 family)